MSQTKINGLKQTIAFVGNPNSGKTTLFNVLTGSKQKTGNFCGVTVDCVCAECKLGIEKVQLVDLPGLYTLTQMSDDAHEDEQITRQFLEDKSCDLIVNVVDAAHLERNLYLTLQCLELGLPVIVVLTRMDLAEKKGLKLNVAQLEKALNCPVVQVSTKTQLGIEQLKNLLFKKINISQFKIAYPKIVEHKISRLQSLELNHIEDDQLIRWIEGEPFGNKLNSAQKEQVQQILEDSAANDSDLDICIAATRYQVIEDLVHQCIHSVEQKISNLPLKSSFRFGQAFDKWACHKWFGMPIFLMVMYGLFFFAMNVGGAFQDCIEQLTHLFLVDGVTELLSPFNAPAWLVGVFQGVGQGLATVLTFVPVIGAMFLALAFLESSGYMARAAIVMDRLMLMLGLPGKSFVPMIVGFGCNVPAILGARALDHKRDRILTVMMSPFMSCGARLAIFTVFVSIFFPLNGHNIVFVLYLIGILMAVLTGLLLKKTLLSGPNSPFIMELPEYTLPPIKSLIRTSWFRLKKFLWNATKLILPICMLISVLNSIHIKSSDLNQPEVSLLAEIGQRVTPAFYPMGLSDENWPATVSLFTGVLAKEVVIGTLNALYTQEQSSENPGNIRYLDSIADAFSTIPENLLTLRGAFSNPIVAQAPIEQLDNVAHQEMFKRFNNLHAAFAYMLFVLLYFPCVSATAAMLKEVKRGWTLFSVVWTTGLAYCVAVFYYQLSTLASHPWQSFIWCLGISLFILAVVWGIHRLGKSLSHRSVPTQIVYN